MGLIRPTVAKQRLQYTGRSLCRSFSSDTSFSSDYEALGPLIKIENATFYHEHPSSLTTHHSASNPPLFARLNYSHAHTPRNRVGTPWQGKTHVAVVGTNPTPFLKVLKGDYISVPPNSRTYPYLSSNAIAQTDPNLRVLSQAIQYVGFSNNSSGRSASGGGVQGAYLSARYESRREETDWTVEQYLRGETELNPAEKPLRKKTDEALFARVVADLRLPKLLSMPVSNLSNGQTRRSRIAKALLNKPELLLLDEPFMGLDPPTLVSLSPILRDIASRSSPSLILGLRPQDPIPDWITNVVLLGQNNTVICHKSLAHALYTVHCWNQAERGHDTSDLGIRMAKALKDTCGPPPFEVANILTSQGVHRFAAVRTAWDQMIKGKLTDSQHEVKNSVAPERSDILRSLQIPERERTREDWINLSCDLSESAMRVLERGMKAPQQSAPTRDEAHGRSASNQPNEPSAEQVRETLIDLTNIVVKYGTKVVLGHAPAHTGHDRPGLNLKIARGSRLLLLGPNGSGKTTLLSLLTSDHPQSYSLPIKFFGRTRLPSPGTPGLSLWEIQSRIGYSSPEVHTFFPKNMTTRQVLESAWAETFSTRPALDDQRNAMVDHFLRTFEPELRQTPATNGFLDWASDRTNHPLFGRLPFGVQRLLLLLRAIIKQPDIIILDEGFSGMSAAVRDKALAWLERGDHGLDSKRGDENAMFSGLTEQQALVVVSHVREEVPSCIAEYVRLPSEEEATEQGRGVETGRSEVTSEEGWSKVWGL